MTVFHLGDIDFNTGTPDGNGALWFITGMEGWDSAPVRSEVILQPTVHGGITVQGLYAPRVFTLNGVCKGATSDGYHQAQYYLQAQTNKLRRVAGDPLIFMAEEDEDRQCEVLRQGPVFTRPAGGSTFSFQITLRADDPLKYSTVEHSNALVGSASEVIVNAGTARVQPRFNTDESTLTQLQNSSYGTNWYATGPALPDNTDIRFREMTVMQGVTSYFDSVSPVSEWWFLEPGNNTVISDQDVTIFWRDAWV